MIIEVDEDGYTLDRKSRLVPCEPTEAMLATQGKSRPDLAKNDAIRRTAEALNAEARRMAAETWAEMIDAALSQRGTE